MLEKYKVLILLSMFIISLSLRVVLTYHNYTAQSTEWADARLYLAHGKSFAEGDFYPSFEDWKFMVEGPMIPAIVALSQIVTGDPVWPVLLLNCLLSSLMVFVLYGIGSRLINQYAGYLLALWSVFNFSLIRLNYQVLKEPLIILLLPLIALTLVNINQKKRALLNVTASSLLFSLLIHTDERFFIYLPAIYAFIIIAFKARERLRYSLIWLAILLITMLPWTIRNYHQFGEMVLLTPRTTAITSKIWGTDFAKMHFSSDDRINSQIGHRIESAQRAAVESRLMPRKYGRFEKYYKAFIHYWQPAYFKLHYIQYGFRPVRWSFAHNLNSVAFYGMFLPFFAAGIVFAIIRKKWLMMFFSSLPLIHGILHTLMIWPLERYRIPFNFMIVLVALWFIHSILANSKFKRKKAG